MIDPSISYQLMTCWKIERVTDETPPGHFHGKYN